MVFIVRIDINISCNNFQCNHTQSNKILILEYQPHVVEFINHKYYFI